MAAGCPCIDPSAGLNTSCFEVTQRGRQFCYPPSYGAALCTTHDQGLPPFCNGDSPSEFCGQSWCWVNSTMCHSSGTTYVASAYRPGWFYSYRTCGGDPTAWRNALISNRLTGRTLTAALPMSHVPMHYHVDSAGNPFVGVDRNFSAPAPAYSAGYAVTYWADLARAGGFQLSWRLVSGGNRAQHRSSWTACVADVAGGIIDVCPSITWMTPGRMAMSTFTQPVRLASFYLMVPKPQPRDDFATKFRFMFQPFTESAWIVIISLVFVVGTLTVYFQPPLIMKAKPTVAVKATAAERLSSNDGWSLARRASRSFLAKKVPEAELVVDDSAGDDDLRPSTWKDLRHPIVLDALQDHIHATFMEFVGAGSDVDPDHVTAVKFVKSGWAVFVLLVLTAYTSSFTAFLVTNNYDIPIDGMDSCRARRCTVCMTAFLENEMRAVYSNEINYRVEPRTNTALTFFSWGFEQIRSGQCDASLIDQTGYEEDPANQACDMMFAGSTALQIYTGFAANPQLADALSYWMRQLSWSAESSYLEVRHRRPLLPAMECNPRPNLNAPRDDAMRLSMYDLIAPFLIMCGFCIIGLLVDCCQRGPPCGPRFSPPRGPWFSRPRLGLRLGNRRQHLPSWHASGARASQPGPEAVGACPTQPALRLPDTEDTQQSVPAAEISGDGSGQVAATSPEISDGRRRRQRATGEKKRTPRSTADPATAVNEIEEKVPEENLAI